MADLPEGYKIYEDDFISFYYHSNFIVKITLQNLDSEEKGIKNMTGIEIKSEDNMFVFKQNLISSGSNTRNYIYDPDTNIFKTFSNPDPIKLSQKLDIIYVGNEFYLIKLDTEELLTLLDLSNSQIMPAVHIDEGYSGLIYMKPIDKFNYFDNTSDQVVYTEIKCGDLTEESMLKCSQFIGVFLRSVEVK